VIHNYVTREFSPNVSVGVSHLDGELWYTQNEVSDRAYYFIEADARVEFASSEVVNVSTGDALFISAGTEYQITGTFTAVLVNSPAFEVKNERERER